MRRGLVCVHVMAVLLLACAPEDGGDSTDHGIGINELMAVSHLRSLAGAQTHARSLALVDEDGDGLGEYLFIAELAGIRPARGGGEVQKPPLLDPGIWRLSTGGFFEMHGYLFGVFLRGADGGMLGEADDLDAPVDVEQAEREWVGCAWPVRYGETGRRTFATDASGIVVAADVPEYSGTRIPSPDACFTEPGTPSSGFSAVE